MGQLHRPFLGPGRAALEDSIPTALGSGRGCVCVSLERGSQSLEAGQPPLPPPGAHPRSEAPPARPPPSPSGCVAV